MRAVVSPSAVACGDRAGAVGSPGDGDDSVAGTAALVAENAMLQKRVDELWAVIGLFKADKLADKLIELKVTYFSSDRPLLLPA